MNAESIPSVAKRSRLTMLSGTLALVTVVAFAFFSYCVRNRNIPRHVELTSLIVASASSIVTIIAGIAALLVALLVSRQLKGCNIAIASVVVGSVVLIVLVPDLIHAKRFNDIDRCMHRLQNLGKEITEYAKSHDGHLPVADNWCDLLMDNSKGLSRDSFSCPAYENGTCSYSFNTNLGGVRLADVSPHIVLLYESDSGWNSAGKGELQSTRHEGGCNALFIDGSVRLFHKSILDSLKDSYYWEIEDANEESQ